MSGETGTFPGLILPHVGGSRELGEELYRLRMMRDALAGIDEDDIAWLRDEARGARAALDRLADKPYSDSILGNDLRTREARAGRLADILAALRRSGAGGGDG